MRVQAVPDDLDRFAGVSTQLQGDLRRTAGQLGEALDAFRSTAGRAQFLPDVPPLDADLGIESGRLQLLAQLTGSLAARLREIDSGSLVVDVDFDLRLLIGVLADLASYRSDEAPPDHDPDAWAATPEGQEVTARARELLENSWFGPGRTDVAELQELLAALPAPLADAVVHSLSDAELRRLVEAITPHWMPNRGWETARRHELWAVIGEKVSLDTWRRLARFTDDIDPPPSTALDDRAAERPDDAAWFHALTYREFDGYLFWRGDGDAHALALNDTTQGRLGNCYLLAAMMGLAHTDPGRLERMFRANPNGTYTVTFADGMKVVVSPDLPVHPDRPRTPAFASRELRPANYDAPATRMELWPLLLEKAYAQRHGGWGRIAGGMPGSAVEELTGAPVRRLDPATADLAEIGRNLDAGRVVTLATLPDERVDDDGTRTYAHPLLTGQHAYVITAVGSDGAIHLHNPWEAEHDGPLTLTEAELRAIGWHIEVNER